MDIKIKSKSQAQRCEVCHKADCFDTAISFCSRCNVATRDYPVDKLNNKLDNKLTNKLDSVVSIKINAPIGVQVERSDRELRLVKAWYDKRLIKFLLLFTIFWNIVLGIFWIVIPIDIISSGEWTRLGELIFLMPFTVVGLSFIYYSIATYKNCTVISVTNKEFTVEHVPMPWIGSQKIDPSKIIQLYVKRGASMESNSNVTYFYDLFAKLKDGKHIKILGTLPSEDVGHFLEKQIEEYLRIADQPIEGENTKEKY